MTTRLMKMNSGLSLKACANRISLSDFSFERAGYGQYDVTYTSPKTGRQWKKHITDMGLIDDTKNSDEVPTQKALNTLKRAVKAEW